MSEQTTYSGSDRQLAAVMFVDIVGYSTMMSENESRTLEIVDAVRAKLKSLVDAHGGKWLKELGDGFLLSFNSASKSVRCALDIQEYMTGLDAKLRIGIHSGEIIFRNEDVYGDGVNIASRLQEIANPGGILISGRLHEDISNKESITTVSLGNKKLKNIDRSIGVFAVVSEYVPAPEEISGGKWTSQRRLTLATIVIGLIAVIWLVASAWIDRVEGKETIAITDEEGNLIEQEIAQADFIKKVIVFPYKNRGDANQDWVQFGIPILLGFDINQDIFTQAQTAYPYTEDIKQAGIVDFSKIPLGVVRNIARDYRYQYYISGEYQKTENGFEVTTNIYDAENGSLISSLTKEGKDLFSISDDMSKSIRLQIGISEVHINSREDLPISEMLTNDIEAFKAFSEGFRVANFEENEGQSIQLLTKATDIDPQFALAHLQLSVLYLRYNQFSTARQFIDRTIELSYKLPKRDQFQAKSIYYFLNEEQDKRKRVLEIWSELYPEDIIPYYTLGLLYYSEGRSDEAIASFKQALQIDDYRGNILVYLSRIYDSKQEYDEGSKYIQRFVDKYPENPQSFQLLGEHYMRRGDFENARSSYEKASLINSNDISPLLNLARMDVQLGEFEKGFETYQKLLSESRTVSDSAAVVPYIRDYYYFRGQFRKGIELNDDFLALYTKVAPALEVSIFRVTRLAEYLEIGMFDEAMKIIKEEEEKLSDSFSDMPAFGYCNYYIYEGDVANAEKYLEQIKEYVAKYGSPSNVEYIYEGELLRLKGEHEKAIEQFEKFSRTNIHVPANYVNASIARSYIALERYDDAESILKKSLVAYPFDGETNVLMGKVMMATKRAPEAREYIERAYSTLQNADPEYSVFRELQDLQSSLEVAS
jgi:adenylate cyclase